MKNMNRICRGLAVMALLWAPSAVADGAVAAYTPEQILAKAIAYHDPNGVWDAGRVRLRVTTTYSEEYAGKTGATDASVALLLSPGHEEFSYVKEVGDDRIVYSVRRGLGSVEVNGSTDVSDEDRERLRLRDPGMYRDYFEYLYGMPMKLRDPGTLLDPEVRSMHFNNRAVWQLRVTYTPDVGEDIWYFYFDHDSFALVGYRFFHDESKNDGEYITFAGEIVDEASGLRLPRTRAWYYNADDGHLATDDIVSIETSD